MTIAIGFIGRPKHKLPKLVWGDLPIIIMASDSQSTYGSVKRVNPNKINVVDFANGQILIAQSGSVELGDKTIEIIKRKASGKTMADFETAMNVVKESIREVRNDLVEWYKECVTDWQRFFWEENNLELLIGYFFDGKPYLWSTSMGRGVFTRIDSFEAIGAGKDLGYFLLKEYIQAIPDAEYGWPIAVSVIEKVIDNIDGCGRPTWVANVIPLPKDIPHTSYYPIKPECSAVIFPRIDTEVISQELKKAYAYTATLRKKDFVNVMKRTFSKTRLLYKKIYEQSERLKKSAN